MKALADSDLQTYNNTVLYSYSEKWSVALNMTDTRNSEWLTARNHFVLWHGRTRNQFDAYLLVVRELAGFLVIISNVIVFFFFDIDELMFPALLEVKKSSGDFHFIRSRRFMYELAFWLSMLCGTFGIFVQLKEFGWIVGITAGILTGASAGCFLAFETNGLFVQIHNATTLANMLVKMCTSHQEELERFEKWKEFYKTSVGALHVWSWRMTPLFGGLIVWFGIGIVSFICRLLFMYTTIMSEPDINDSERIEVFQNSSEVQFQMVSLIAFTTMLLVLVGAMSMISIRYQRLHLLIATLGLPQHHMDDFNILQQHNAALTIFDQPITVNTTVSILRLLFVQSVVAILAMLG